MDQGIIRKVIKCLNTTLCKAKFRPGNLIDSESIEYAYIELTTTNKIAGSLEEEANSQLLESGGFRAQLEFTELNKVKNGKYRYSVEIIPRDYVPIGEFEKVTEEILRALPKIIKNYRMKNLDKG